MPDTNLSSLLAALGAPELADHPDLAGWVTHTRGLLATRPNHHDALPILLAAWQWWGVAHRIAATPRADWAALLQTPAERAGIGTFALRGLLAEIAHQSTASHVHLAEELAVRLAVRATALERLRTASDAELRAALVLDTDTACAALEALRDADSPLAGRVARLCPEIAALAITADPSAATEHEPAPDTRPAAPLLDHASRVLARKLIGLEKRQRHRFQHDDALSATAFVAEADRVARLTARGMLPAVRAALLHLDFAKGGHPAQRARWQQEFGVDLSVHNLAARHILEAARAPGAATNGVLTAFAPLAAHQDGTLVALTLALVESHGLAGQSVRGETPTIAFARWVKAVGLLLPALARSLGVTVADASELAHDALHVINVCDTAGVREGLLTDVLDAELLRVRDWLACQVAAIGADAPLDVVEEALRNAGGAPHRDQARARLVDRLGRLRTARQQHGEPPERTADAITSLSDEAVAWLDDRLLACQLWYAETATSALSPSAQLTVLAMALAAADATPQIDTRRPFHVSLQPLVDRLGAAATDRAAAYRVRLAEALLASVSLERLCRGEPVADSPSSSLATFATTLGGGAAVAVAFEESAEATALLTLLPIYELKSSAAFHATLKSLCDLYGLRKDEFDRLSNEAQYLTHMNASRSDKARMLDHVRPGRIVEIGPGGGVVLDLCEERFPDSEVVGIDVSAMVVEALHAKKQREGRRWRIVEGDAFELARVLGEDRADTVICCSLLHEIYSYVEREDPTTGARRRFQLDSVRDFLRASFDALLPGGRIVIRDGVAPPPATRILELLADDAPSFFDLFVEQFEGRRIAFERLGERRVRLDAADAMEFLYTYTWGPDSFPYEVREQYGVLTYEAYKDHVLAWLNAPPWQARWVELPPAQRSYLQPGYDKGLAGKVALFDGDGRPVPLPDSNALWVYEKVAIPRP